MDNPVIGKSVAGVGPGTWDAGKLARDQETAAIRRIGENARVSNSTILYRIYTEYAPNLGELASRYFTGFTLVRGTGYYQGEKEYSSVIEIVGTLADLQSVTHFAGDIRVLNNQTSVLITWGRVSSLMVTA